MGGGRNGTKCTVLERFGEADILCYQPLGIADSPLLHVVADRPNEEEAALRDRVPAQQLQEGSAQLAEESAVNADNYWAKLVFAGDDHRHILVRQEDKFPPRLPELPLSS